MCTGSGQGSFLGKLLTAVPALESVKGDSLEDVSDIHILPLQETGPKTVVQLDFACIHIIMEKPKVCNAREMTIHRGCERDRR